MQTVTHDNVFTRTTSTGISAKGALRTGRVLSAFAALFLLVDSVGKLLEAQPIIMHKTNGHWEAGAIPSRELIAKVGTLIGELAKAKVLLGGEGLRASSEGVRLTFSGGTRTISKGPFEGVNELPCGFSILRVESVEEAIEWASRQAKAVGDTEIDIRPVTEPWDIGLAPKPERVTT